MNRIIVAGLIETENGIEVVAVPEEEWEDEE